MRLDLTCLDIEKHITQLSFASWKTWENTYRDYKRSRVKSKAKSPTCSECSQTVAYVAGGVVCAKAKFERRRTSGKASRGMGRRWIYARWGGLRCLWRLRHQNLTFARGTKPPATQANKLALVWPTTAMRRNFVLLVLLLTYRLSNAFK